jgi:hypothetical protein
MATTDRLPDGYERTRWGVRTTWSSLRMSLMCVAMSFAVLIRLAFAVADEHQRLIPALAVCTVLPLVLLIGLLPVIAPGIRGTLSAGRCQTATRRFRLSALVCLAGSVLAIALYVRVFSGPVYDHHITEPLYMLVGPFYTLLSYVEARFYRKLERLASDPGD